jgi:hypothetical protein
LILKTDQKLKNLLNRKEKVMFEDKELETIEDLCDRKIDDILNKEGSESDAYYIRDLQTLFTLKNAADQKIQQKKSKNSTQKKGD